MKYLWRATVAGIAKPLYLVAQNMPSAGSAISSHPEVQPQDLLHLQRIAQWDDQTNMTVVIWPEPPPPPPLEDPPPP